MEYREVAKDIYSIRGALKVETNRIADRRAPTIGLNAVNRALERLAKQLEKEPSNGT